MTTLVQLLDRAAGFEDTGLRFVDRRGQATFAPWSEIHGEAKDVAARLLRRGVQRHDRVALIYVTGLDFFRAFFGTLLAGAIPVPLYPPVRLGRLDEYHRRTGAMLQAVTASIVLADSRILRFLGPTLASAKPTFGGSTLEQLPAASGSLGSGGSDFDNDGLNCSEEDLALVQFSSGTTVEPKPVALSHRAILAQVAALNSFWPDDEPDQAIRHTGVSWLPLYHDMGLIGCVFPALERPSVLTLIGPEVFVARPALWLRTISQYRASISVAPNFAYGLCTEKIADEELEGVDLSCWRIALNGAEAISANVLRRFQERFAAWGFRPEALTPVYGLSEATLAVTFSALDKPFRTNLFDRRALTLGQAQIADDGCELTSVGTSLPGSEIRIVDSRNQPLAANRIGRIQVSGPSLMSGYLHRPDLTAQVLQQGWLDTGDLGFLYDDELFLTGRSKEIVILRGRNYAPAEIEQATFSVEGVRTGCVIAASYASEDGNTESLLLLVEHRNSFQGDPLALAEACASKVLANVGIRPDRIEILAPGTLPRTSSGKMRRQTAVAQWQAGELAAPKKVTPWLITSAWARSMLARTRLPKKPPIDA